MQKAGRSEEGTAIQFLNSRTVHTPPAPAAPLPSPLSPASVCISHSAVLPSLLSLLFFLLLLVPFLCSKTVAANEIRDCTSADLIFQYTTCDQNNKRWLFAVPRSHNFLCSADSMPPPRHGLNCTVTCPGGHFLEMRSQECRLCQPGTFSLGDRVRYEQFGEDGKLPDGFSVENTPEESFGTGGGGSGSSHCASGGGWTVEEGELRYRWTGCVSTLSISLHLTRPGFAEFQYQLSKDSRALIQMLQVRNAQCQSYGHTRNPLVQWRQKSKQSSNAGAETAAEQGPEGGADIRVQRLALRRGQNLITWTVAVNPVLSSRMEMIRLIRLDISGLAFSPVCSPCPAGTFTAIAGAQQCEPCGLNEFAGPGAARCQQCLPSMWAGPRSELCRPRPACSAIDFFPVRPTICQSSSTNDSSSGGGQQKIYQRKISPQICRDDALFAPNIREEPCPPCGPGMQRTGTGKCELCPEGQVSAGGEACSACSHGWIAERGLFLNRWDSLPTGLDLKMECEFLSAEETPTECRLSPSWISHGDRLESMQTRMRGLALELSLHLRDGFYSPLHSGKASADNPLGHISLELELQCRDSCQFYVVQEFEAQSPGPVSTTAEADTGRQLQMLALLNGTQPRRRLLFPVMDPRPRRLLIAFTRSGALLERDELTDRAIIYSLNVTNTGRPTGPPKATGQGRRCVQCPRLGAGGQCQPCPPGEYWAWQSCHQCPPGTVVNQTAAMESSDDNRQPPCSPCPAHFERSADGFSCEFSGHFELADEPNGTEKLHFDLSALRESGPLTARGIRVFSRDGQSYQHQFNFSLFPGHWVRCRDSMAESASSVGGGQPAQAQQEEADAALFCRSAAIPLQLQNDGAGGDESRSSGGAAGELFVSSTILSRKLALVSRQRQFAGFHLSDEQLEYEPDSAKAQRPLDMHFFFEPLPALGLSNCPNGTIAVATVRCEPTAVLKPLARLSRRCPDGTCDGCLYHAIVESAHGCPVCTAQDYREIRGECINDRQIVHLIPAKHCVLSGTHSQQQREESCRSVLSARIRLILAISVGLILTLLLVILFIYRRNRTLEYRYSRLVEGREMDSGVRSCALGSEQDGSEEEEDSADDQQEMVDSSRARVFFSTKRAKKTPPGGKYSQRSGRAEERAEFIAEEESD